jgi:hypothetical protein
MSRDQLVRLLLRLGILFVGLQIAVFVLFIAAFVFTALGGDIPLGGGSDLPDPSWHGYSR